MTLQAGKDDDGRRLDRIIRKACAALPLSAVHRIIRRSLVKVNGRKAGAADRVKQGDIIDIFIPAGAARAGGAEGERGAKPAKPAVCGIDIIFENGDILIVNKKSGVASCGVDSLQTQVEFYLKDKIASSLSFKSGALHRLDRETSGAIMFSKSLRGAQYISGALREGLLRKTYLALVEGELRDGEVWEDNLSRDKTLKKTFRARPRDSGAKKALTVVTPLCVKNSRTLIKAEIMTGRTHQIRAQAALRGHPLVNDGKYGASSKRGAAFFLHSLSIEFPPDNPLNLPAKVVAPPPHGGWSGEAAGALRGAEWGGA